MALVNRVNLPSMTGQARTFRSHPASKQAPA
jgi:hypothetical protein